VADQGLDDVGNYRNLGEPKRLSVGLIPGLAVEGAGVVRQAWIAPTAPKMWERSLATCSARRRASSALRRSVINYERRAIPRRVPHLRMATRRSRFLQ
jgi:hypothetical protein